MYAYIKHKVQYVIVMKMNISYTVLSELEYNNILHYYTYI